MPSYVRSDVISQVKKKRSLGNLFCITMCATRVAAIVASLSREGLSDGFLGEGKVRAPPEYARQTQSHRHPKQMLDDFELTNECPGPPSFPIFPAIRRKRKKKKKKGNNLIGWLDSWLAGCLAVPRVLLEDTD